MLNTNHNNIDLNSQTLGFKIKEYIDENYKEDIKLNDIAEKFYLSPYYLSHIFKKEVGFSPIDYLINRRIGESQNLLLTTNMTLSDISSILDMIMLIILICCLKKLQEYLLVSSERPITVNM